MWRLLGLLAVFAGLAAISWLARGGPGAALRGEAVAGVFDVRFAAAADALGHTAQAAWNWRPTRGMAPLQLLVVLIGCAGSSLATMRMRARRRRSYVRLSIEPYRGDHASMEELVTMFGALHKWMLRRWWRRLFDGQPSISLELHHRMSPSRSVWLAVACPRGWESACEAVLQATYPNCRLRPMPHPLGCPPAVLRLKKHAAFIKRVKVLDSYERRREPPVNRLLTAIGDLR